MTLEEVRSILSFLQQTNEGIRVKILSIINGTSNDENAKSFAKLAIQMYYDNFNALLEAGKLNKIEKE